MEANLLKKKPRLIAFYLPQYHPIPENNEWWGKGFTEWTNVAKAKPLFKGHYQPHLPADLGFYDLRVPEVREQQAELAREAGIEGFCYYHYWFNGKQLLDRPFREVLESGKPDFPFCLCWANENWTKRWDGLENEILIEQHYSEEDDRDHIHALLPALRDRRYIRINGKPLLLIYRLSDLPNPRRTVEIWREVAASEGIGELFLCKVLSNARERSNPLLDGLDASVDFQPDWTLVNNLKKRSYILKRLMKYFPNFITNKISFFQNKIVRYDDLVKVATTKEELPWMSFPCVFPSWDNSPRKKQGATIIAEASPEKFQAWLGNVLQSLISKEHSPNLLFINAWNEWGEGCHLEPDQKFGNGNLLAIKNALEVIECSQK